MSSSNADSMTVASSVDLSQENSNAKLQRLRNNEKKIADIINLLIKISTLEKEMSKDYLWREIVLKLMCHLRLESEEKHHTTQNAFITKNVQKLKTSVQLLSKQLQTQKNTRFSLKIMSWANMTKEELSTRKQRLREESSLLCKKCKVMIKIADKEEIKKMQKKIIEQIFQRIANMSTSQRNLIMSFCKLSSKDIFLHAVSSDAWANLKKIQEWAKEIMNLTRISRRIFAVLTHNICTTIDMSNQKKVISKLIKNNARLHENLKILRIVWLKKVAESEKTYSSLIMKITTEAMTNQLMNVSMLNAYFECACKLFEKNCCITQCFRCQEFDHMIRFCRKNQRCIKCADKHHIKRCMMFSNRKRCINCNRNHELWRCICLKWQQQMKQAFKIYKNKSFKYSEASKYNCTLLQFLSSSLSSSFADSMNSLNSMNSSSSMNSSRFMNSLSSANSLSSTTAMLKTRSLVAHELTWQMIEVKKRRVNHFSCVSSDSDKTLLEQSQKWQIRRRDKLSMIESIQRVFFLQSQQQLQITL